MTLGSTVLSNTLSVEIFRLESYKWILCRFLRIATIGERIITPRLVVYLLNSYNIV